ncbi:MAG: deoxyribodipyrimidine photo-lyase [candidate division KSB1 bacterium]|nr:deoxyribodipyrimidine photo-lyase [candidate division KSB1 bacterium]
MMTVDQDIAVFWFRRDLRLEDNAGLTQALTSGYPVLPVFLFDDHILADLPDPYDLRVDFIHTLLQDLYNRLSDMNSSLWVRRGDPVQLFQTLCSEFSVKAVYTNTDYEPYAIKRDQAVSEYLKSRGIPFHSYKDQVIFEKDEILKKDGTPYRVYTPYKNRWKQEWIGQKLLGHVFDTASHFSQFIKTNPLAFPQLEQIGFESTQTAFSTPEIPHEIIRHYHNRRDFPAMQGTSKLGPHLRFGSQSIRRAMQDGFHLNEIWFDELIWREFYMMILHHYPRVETQPFRSKYETIEWNNDPEEFETWCRGETGFPIVDAGMRELNETGFMHNRVRMIAAGFLTKTLLIDWRWGERYFAEKLLDYDLAANNGNWQWAAGTGCDAAPYFRIFNPITQMRKYDKKLEYIKRWVGEYGAPHYPQPMVDLRTCRERALRVYKKAAQS